MAGGLWPSGPRSYFIDTILSGFPFPKIYLYDTYDRAAREVRKELVDGQQRLGTLEDFAKGKFTISGESKFAGKRFNDLDDDEAQAFMAYPVSCDVIRNATRGDILEMFRRTNAYTLPLNEAEKRHSSYYGEFKWYVNGITDTLGDFLSSWVFTNRQIVRMADAELIAEITQALMESVTSSSPNDLNSLYRKYDEHFAAADRLREVIIDQFVLISERLPEIPGSYMCKPYALYSLITALAHLTAGVDALDRQLPGMSKPNHVDWEQAQENLLALARAHETKDLAGPSERYVWGCMAGTNRAPRRLARLVAILNALGFSRVPGELHDITDNA